MRNTPLRAIAGTKTGYHNFTRGLLIHGAFVFVKTTYFYNAHFAACGQIVDVPALGLALFQMPGNPLLHVASGASGININTGNKSMETKRSDANGYFLFYDKN